MLVFWPKSKVSFGSSGLFTDINSVQLCFLPSVVYFCPWSRFTLSSRITELFHYQNNLIKTLADAASPADCSHAYLLGINRHLSVSLLNRRSASVHWVRGR